MRIKSNLLGVVATLWTLSLSSLSPPLENILMDEAICATYEIAIPHYPNAYNPSLIPYEDGYLLSFRYRFRFPEWSQDFKKLSAGSLIGLAHLDKKFRLQEDTVQLLEVPSLEEHFSLYAEDARLFVLNGHIHLIFNDLSEHLKQRLYLAELTFKRGRWQMRAPAAALAAPQMQPVEKNWSPFCVGSSLYLIYGDEPRTILECDRIRGRCTPLPQEEETGPLPWAYGLIRGGTPALLLEDKFLTFYHSSLADSDWNQERIYFLGAYTFDAQPPFAIQTFTPQPLGQADWYKGASSQERIKKVVFPGGIVHEGDRIHVAWGYDDKKIMITTFDLEKLFASMQKAEI